MLLCSHNKSRPRMNFANWLNCDGLSQAVNAFHDAGAAGALVASASWWGPCKCSTAISYRRRPRRNIPESVDLEAASILRKCILDRLYSPDLPNAALVVGPQLDPSRSEKHKNSVRSVLLLGVIALVWPRVARAAPRLENLAWESLTRHRDCRVADAHVQAACG